jgi:hypothetical protein
MLPDERGCNSAPYRIARGYTEREWTPVLVPYREKGPTDQGWQKRKITKDNVGEYFDGEPVNIGVKLGRESGGLCDVDLDCPEAIALAEYLLPETDAVFGRQSKPGSHRLYITELCDTCRPALLGPRCGLRCKNPQKSNIFNGRCRRSSLPSVIAEDEQESPPSAAATSQPLGAAPATQNDSMPSEPVASPAPISGAGPTERCPSEASAAGQGARSDGLLSPATTAALDAAFNTLAQTAQPRRGRTVEELVSELMRPMLKTWLDENLPAIVERLVRAEIEHISRARD